MKDRPINLKAEEVRTVLDTGKLVRIIPIKVQPSKPHFKLWFCVTSTEKKDDGKWHWGFQDENCRQDFDHIYFTRPYSKGQLLWVRETWHSFKPTTKYAAHEDASDEVSYKATERLDMVSGAFRWRSSTHMPRWASRITLEVESVDVVHQDGRWCWKYELRRV